MIFTLAPSIIGSSTMSPQTYYQNYMGVHRPNPIYGNPPGNPYPLTVQASPNSNLPSAQVNFSSLGQPRMATSSYGTTSFQQNLQIGPVVPQPGSQAMTSTMTASPSPSPFQPISPAPTPSDPRPHTLDIVRRARYDFT